MNSELIAQIEAAMAMATPGEWRRASTRFNAIAVGPFTLTTEDIIANTNEKRDAKYIAKVNPAVMAQVLAYVRELEARTLVMPCERFRTGDDYDDGFANGWNAHAAEVRCSASKSGIPVKVEG